MEKAKEEVLKMQKERDWKQFHSPENLAKSISIEAGELLECFQWNNTYKKEKVISELADVANYCLLLANELDVELEDIVLKKIEINKKKYPIEKAKGKSLKYNELK